MTQVDCASELEYVKTGNPHTKLPKTKVEVEVTATESGGSISYTHVVRSHNNNGKVDLPKDSGPYKIVFSLDDDTNRGLRFDAAAPFYCDVTQGGRCPSSVNRQQIMVASCEDDKLTVVDWNYGTPMELHYQLNFTDGNGVAVKEYDPIIQNGGGTKS